MTEVRTGRGAWAEPAVEEVAAGVWRIPLPLPDDGLRAVNVYALVGERRITVIDSGWSVPVARELLVSQLATLDIAPGDIGRFLITHIHRDHYTLGIALRREFGMEVALGAGERPSLEKMQQPGKNPMAPQLQVLRLLGADYLADRIDAHVRAGDRAPDPDWESPDEWLSPGPVHTGDGRTLEVVETPGHTQGHVVFHDLAAGLLFAGDHVLPTITPSIGLEAVRSSNPLGQFLASLALMRSRPDARLLPAHGPVAPSVHARVDELVDHHGRRLAHTEAAVAAGATSGLDVARLLTWTRRETAFEDLDDFNAMLAVGETGAHLALLVAQGRLTESGGEGIRRYLPA